MQLILAKFLLSSPWEQALALFPWPVWVLLFLMSTLAGIGLHTILRRWIGRGWLSSLLLGQFVVSFWIWTLCYLVAFNAEQLLAHQFYRVPAAPDVPVAEQVGEILLQPLKLSIPASQPLSSQSLLKSLANMPEAEYLQALQKQRQSSPATKNPGHWLIEGVLTWMTMHHPNWPLLSEAQALADPPYLTKDIFVGPNNLSNSTGLAEPDNAPDNAPDDAPVPPRTRFLMGLLASLPQSQPNALKTEQSLSIAQWHQLLGSRLISYLYGPIATEALSWLAAEIAALLLLWQLICLALVWPKKKSAPKPPIEKPIEEPIEEPPPKKTTLRSRCKKYLPNYSKLADKLKKIALLFAEYTIPFIKILQEIISKFILQEKTLWKKRQARTNAPRTKKNSTKKSKPSSSQSAPKAPNPQLSTQKHSANKE